MTSASGDDGPGGAGGTGGAAGGVHARGGSGGASGGATASVVCSADASSSAEDADEGDEGSDGDADDDTDEACSLIASRRRRPRLAGAPPASSRPSLSAARSNTRRSFSSAGAGAVVSRAARRSPATSRGSEARNVRLSPGSDGAPTTAKVSVEASARTSAPTLGAGPPRPRRAGQPRSASMGPSSVM